MSSWIQFALLGLGSAAAYAMLAQGVVLIYRASGVINFAQGGFAMAGAFAFFELHTESGIATVPALVLTALIGVLIGVVSYGAVMRPLRRASALSRVIASLGILTILQAAAVLRYGENVANVDSPLPETPVHLLGVVVPADRLWLGAIVLVVTAALSLLSHRTRGGLATFAVSENEQAASALGWSPDMISAVNWSIGGALAVLAGVAVAPLVGLSVSALTVLLIPALAVALLGQFQSFWVALLGAVVIGVAQSELVGHSSVSWLPQVVPFAVIIAIMVIRGRALPLRSQLLERPPRVGSGRINWPLAVLGLAIAVVVTLVGDEELVTHLTTSEAFAILMLSAVVLTGYTGQLSLAQLSIAGIAALVAGRLVESSGWNFVPAMLLGVVAAAVVGVLFALPALRTRGVNLAVITIGLGVAISAAIFTNPDFTGGVTGTSVGPQTVFGIDVDVLLHPWRYSLVVLSLLTIALLGVTNLRRSSAGRRLIAVRLNERAAAALGVNVAASKVYAFSLSAIIAGIGGVALAFQGYNIRYDAFNTTGSIAIVTLAVVGGIGYATGALLGSTLAVGGIGTLISRAIFGSEADNWLALLGGVFVIIILLQDPNGLASQYSRGGRKLIDRLRKPPPPPALADRPLEVARRQAATLEVRDVTVQFGGVVALKDASLEVKPGQILGLIGPNGAGKTTLVDAVTGFNRPRSGEILVDGDSISGWSVHRRARRGIVRSFQSLELFDDLTVFENLHTASDSHDLPTYLSAVLPHRQQELPPVAIEAIHDLGLGDDLNRRAEELPYGRRRLLAIARTLAADPALLLLDEPAAGLDTVESAELGRLLRTIVEKTNVGILLVEHEMPLVMAVCDSIVVLDFGSEIATGSPEEIRRDPAVIEAYLGASGSASSPHSASPATVSSQGAS